MILFDTGFPLATRWGALHGRGGLGVFGGALPLGAGHSAQ